MNFAAENEMDADDQTQSAGFSLVEEKSHPTIEHLVAVRQNRQLVKVFRPREKNITFGRSSRCSITLPDPRFSRKAGEIVLGPVPILRRYKDGEKNSEMTPIVPGKPYRFQPYTLTLMESGDVIFNRNKKKDRSKTGMLRSMLFILAALSAGSILFLHQGMTNMVPKGQQESASILAVSEQDQGEIISKPEMKENNENTETTKSASSEALTEKHGATLGIPSGNPPPTPSVKKGVPQVARLKIDDKNRKFAIHADELDKAIKTAALLIEQGNLNMAGRALAPLLAYVDNDQRKFIIEALDPPIEALFRNAYMIKPYELDRSKEILQGIIESRLEILPSYMKAKRVLDTE
ncbi:MAG: hypothetical protein P1S59_11965 [bacterium]|nr:hypothetical protein [bacterium]